jgi:hypothetical protein
MSSPAPAPAPAPAPTAIAVVLDKNLTTLVNCLQNVIYFIMLVNFVETGMLAPCFTAHIVSPVESWKGLFYNMWYSVLVLYMMVAFKDTLEALLLFENHKRNRESRKDATTIIVANETGAQIQHTDNNGAATPAWPAVACYLIEKCLNEKNETKEQGQQASTQNDAVEATTPPSRTEDEIKPDTANAEDEIKPDTANAEDEIKPDTASASSSARSSADTSDARD